MDLFGLPADYDAMNAIAHEHDLFVIEDGAQSFGAQYKGKRACSLAKIGCTSFFPAKPLGCYGDGGMCFTDDEHLAQTMRSLSVHGQGSHKYENVRIGINGRLDTFQAAILLAKFGIFDEEIRVREQVATNYSNLLSIQQPMLSHPEFHLDSARSGLSILSSRRMKITVQKLQSRLKDANIPSAIYYPRPLHLQKAFAALGYKEDDFPVSEEAAKRIFSIPMHPYLSREDQERIAQVLAGDRL